MLSQRGSRMTSVGQEGSGAAGQFSSAALIGRSLPGAALAFAAPDAPPPRRRVTLVLRLPPKKERRPDTARSSLGTWWRASWPGHRTLRDRTRFSGERGAR